MVIAEIPENLFFGLKKGYSDTFDYEDSKRNLFNKLLLCIQDDNCDSTWKPFCNYILQQN